MARYDDSAAYAANWRTILLADAGLGVVGALVGLVILATLHVVIGAMVASAGLVYLFPVARRARRWAALRGDAGLE